MGLLATDFNKFLENSKPMKKWLNDKTKTEEVTSRINRGGITDKVPTELQMRKATKQRMGLRHERK